jgi:transposase-like protein
MDSAGRARKREDWRRLISEHQQSGLTVKAFCQKEGVSEALFYSWRKKVAADEPARFALVATNGAGAASAPALQRIELLLAGGDRLEIPAGTDEATLRTVLRLLRERV